jgi:hypothetical protein
MKKIPKFLFGKKKDQESGGVEESAAHEAGENATEEKAEHKGKKSKKKGADKPEYSGDQKD